MENHVTAISFKVIRSAIFGGQLCKVKDEDPGVVRKWVLNELQRKVLWAEVWWLSSVMFVFFKPFSAAVGGLDTLSVTRTPVSPPAHQLYYRRTDADACNICQGIYQLVSFVIHKRFAFFFHILSSSNWECISVYCISASLLIYFIHTFFSLTNIHFPIYTIMLMCFLSSRYIVCFISANYFTFIHCQVNHSSIFSVFYCFWLLYVRCGRRLSPTSLIRPLHRLP